MLENASITATVINELKRCSKSLKEEEQEYMTWGENTPGKLKD